MKKLINNSVVTLLLIASVILIVAKEEDNYAMVNLANVQRTYLSSENPEDREILFYYEKDIHENNGISWQEIYASRNKIRRELGIGKDCELTLLAKIQRKYLINPDVHNKTMLYQITTHMFDSLSAKEINISRRRVKKEIKKGINSGDTIVALMMNDEESERILKEFIYYFAPPLNIQEIIERNKTVEEDLIKDEYGRPVVFAKGTDLSRFFNAQRMRNCIERNNFTLLAVPKKWLYRVNGQWKVYAEYIPAKKVTFTLAEIKELTALAEQMGFRDWSRTTKSKKTGEITEFDEPNIVQDARNGKITFIDTEDRSFRSKGFICPSFPRHCKVQHAYNLYKYFYQEMDDTPKQWLLEHIDYLKGSAEGTREIEYPQHQFDDPNFDFEKIKEELEEDIDRIRY